MLVNLKYNFKITTSQIVDKCISAKIPDCCKNHTLHDRDMIHLPCGDLHLVKERNIILSKYNNLKSYLEETRMDADVYLCYRWRNKNKSFECPDGYIIKLIIVT